MENLWEGLGLCFSEDGDLLSQWRAYTGDGSGVSIGFAREYVDWLVDTSRGADVDLELRQLEYRSKEHDKLVKPVYEGLRRLLESDDNFPPSGSTEVEEPNGPKLVELRGRLAVLTLLREAMHAFDGVFSLKHSAFSEEREWRLLHSYSWQLTDPCLYRAVERGIVPYKVCPLRQSEQSPIAEVVLGPRHTTPISVVKNYLAQHGFEHVNVRPSLAPYR
jgi:Protein of unknown function (DUF2971)